MPPKKKTNIDKTRQTLFKLLNKNRASEPVSETQDSQAQANSQSEARVWFWDSSAEVEEVQREECMNWKKLK